jgi:hypothetical protein
MADTSTIASLATAGGTLVLAIASFSSTRSANRSARIAERALDLGRRPVLIPAHEWDVAERVPFGDREIVQLRGGYAAVEERGSNLYFAAPLRNVGTGLGVLTSWRLRAGSKHATELPDVETFVEQSRHLYVPARDLGFWQGAIRVGDTDRGDADELRRAIETGERITLHLRYADQDGGHDTVSGYSLLPDENGDWLFSIIKHWQIG